MEKTAAAPCARICRRRRVSILRLSCPGDHKHLIIKSDGTVVPVFGLNARAKELVAGIELIARSLSNVRRLARMTDVEAQSLLDCPSTVCAASPAKLPYFRTLLLARIGQSVKCQIGLTSLRKALASRIDPYGGPT